MIYYYSIFYEISTTIVDRKKLHYAIYAERRAFYERSVIKRTRRHPRATTLPGLARWLMQFFPGTGIFRSTQMIVLLRGRGAEERH